MGKIIQTTQTGGENSKEIARTSNDETSKNAPSTVREPGNRIISTEKAGAENSGTEQETQNTDHISPKVISVEKQGPQNPIFPIKKEEINTASNTENLDIKTLSEDTFSIAENYPQWKNLVKNESLDKMFLLSIPDATNCLKELRDYINTLLPLEEAPAKVAKKPWRKKKD